MATVDQATQLRVTVVYSPAPREVLELELTLDDGSTVAQALTMATHQGLAVPEDASVGVWGKKIAPAQLLKDADRVEIYRGLTVDPKVARRLRFAGQGAKSAGLFSTRRAGAKAGY